MSKNSVGLPLNDFVYLMNSIQNMEVSFEKEIACFMFELSKPCLFHCRHLTSATKTIESTDTNNSQYTILPPLFLNLIV